MKAYISEKANKELISYLKGKGLKTELVKENLRVGIPIAAHPDIFYCDLKTELYKGDPLKLNQEYPYDAIYNAARLGEYFICGRYVDPNLLARAVSLELKPVFVKQGYVKCNMAIVDDCHVITEDRGIAKSLKEIGIDVLLIEPGFVKLSGFPYGFIGGASFRLKDEFVFNGDITKHVNYYKIKEYIENAGLRLKFFDYPLTDIGSVFCTCL